MKLFSHIKIYTLFLLLVSFYNTFAEDDPEQRYIVWTENKTITLADNSIGAILYFDDAVNSTEFDLLPLYYEMIALDSFYDHINIEIIDPVFEEVEMETLTSVSGLENIEKEILVDVNVITERKRPGAVIKILPLRLNALTGKYEKLVSFGFKLLYGNKREAPFYKNLYRENSVLSSGTWYKVYAKESGVYKISYQDISGMGIDPTSIDPRNFRLFGNGGGMLPERNEDSYQDDLVENAIFVSGEDDGSFDTEDYILFYGESSTTWEYFPPGARFEHTKNLYSDTTCYFLSFDQGIGKRIENISSTTLPVTDTVTTFIDFIAHDIDAMNLTKSGKIWYGEEFSIGDTILSLTYNFPNLDTSSNAHIISYLAAKSTEKSTYTITSDGNYILDVNVTGISPSSFTVFARKVIVQSYFYATQDDINIEITYSPPTSSSKGWLNYFELNAYRHLIFGEGQMLFRDNRSAGWDHVGEFIVSNAAGIKNIWEITDPKNVGNVEYIISDNELKFRLKTDSIRQFIAFDGSEYYTPALSGAIENQNLHGIGDVDMIIISHPLFLDQAERLAEIHRNHDDLNVKIFIPEKIYNEFSSGTQDITAMRNFIKMIYNKAEPGSEPRYLLLFGDGSYDPKDRLQENTNFIPAFQSNQSLLIAASFVTDDYYGILDDGEGFDAHGTLDIGIGRFPVKTWDEAKEAVDKVEHYISRKQETFGNWRNVVCFIADDEDQNLHLNQAEELADYIDSNYYTYNVDKIYLDSYNQIPTPGGARYPDVNNDINERVKDGALIINYTGHGGETGWSGEKVLEIPDITQWENFDKMPLFVTATCEFSRFDDPGRTAAGELVFLNPNGGGIALITTTRLAFAQSNFTLNKRLYQFIFEKPNNEYPRLGDVIRKSKIPVIDNNRNIVLLGDPALRLVYPENNIITTSINNEPAIGISDTVKALTKVTVTGVIQDAEGKLVDGFNGILHPEVFDKPTTISTIGNDPKSYPSEFNVQKNCLYKGNVSVEKGEFSFTFMMPRDIFYEYGLAKLSYYAHNGNRDAAGYYNTLLLGGLEEEAANDKIGPEIEIFLNDENFISGDLINPDPLLIIYLSDESGINSLGNGIGHDIMLNLYGMMDNTIILNEFFVPNIDSFQSGKIEYPLSNLPNGTHFVNLKAWDLQNNSSTEIAEFLVSDNIKLAVGNLINYPNPVATNTYFTFDHNQYNAEMEVEIQLYDINGKLVNIIGPVQILSTGYQPAPIEWDGKDINGGTISQGVYVYKMIIDNNKDFISELSGKLIVVH